MRNSPNMRKVDRWGTYNYFHDVVSQKLKPMDIAVWNVIFRHADQWGLARLSKTKIRVKSGIKDKRTLNRSLERLIERKLIGVVKKGYWDKKDGWICSVWWHRAKRLPEDR